MPIASAKIQGKHRKELIRQHRLKQYLESLDLLFEGRENPEWVHYRGKKLKEVSK